MVFTTERPVTQEAEVEVNKALIKPTDSPLVVATGRFNKMAAKKINKAKLDPKIRGGFFFNRSYTLKFKLFSPKNELPKTRELKNFLNFL